MNALLLCGGGSRGAVEVGLYKALADLDIHIDLIFGTSVGALNGVLIAAGATPADLAVLWRRLERQPLFPFNWRALWRGWRMPSLSRTDHLAALLKAVVPVTRFDELRIPLVVTATDLLTAQPVYLASGDLLPALLASAALPPYFPPVTHLGRQLIDGGVAANLPIGEAVARGARRLFALLCHCSEETLSPPRGVLDIQARALRIAIERQMRCEIARYQTSAQLIILEPCFEFPRSTLRIERVTSLIDLSYEFVRAELVRLDLGVDAATVSMASRPAGV